MMLRKIIAPLAIGCFLLTACADAENSPKTTMGTILGAGLGALAGSQVGSGKGQLAAVAIGALAGSMFGNEIGKSLDKADRAYMQQAATTGLEKNRSGQSSTWRNPDSGHSGTVTPTQTVQVAGRDCRDYESTVTIDGKTERAIGRACRNSDGTWQITN